MPANLPTNPDLPTVLSHHIEAGTVNLKELAAWSGYTHDAARDWRDGNTSPRSDALARIIRHAPEALALDLLACMAGRRFKVEPSDPPDCNEPPLVAGMEADERHAGWLRKLMKYLRDNLLTRRELVDVLADLRWFRCYLDRMEMKLLRRAAREHA